MFCPKISEYLKKIVNFTSLFELLIQVLTKNNNAMRKFTLILALTFFLSASYGQKVLQSEGCVTYGKTSTKVYQDPVKSLKGEGDVFFSETFNWGDPDSPQGYNIPEGWQVVDENAANFILFFTTLFLALALSRKYGSFWDKIIIGMSPTSSAPSWLYGIFLILIFAAILKILPFGGVIDAPVPKDFLGRSLSVLRHLILPASSLIISQFFYSIYNWRTFFLIYSSEDYVEMAKAKGLPSRDVERRYILRPTLPTIITAFALLLIGTWTGAIITETVFQWPGLGRVTFRAIGLYDTPVIVGTTIIYAYLLAITVFLLDIVYALVDPRVKIGGGGEPKK